MILDRPPAPELELPTCPSLELLPTPNDAHPRLLLLLLGIPLPVRSLPPEAVLLPLVVAEVVFAVAGIGSAAEESVTDLRVL